MSPKLKKIRLMRSILIKCLLLLLLAVGILMIL
nr:MAG TPA_asm: hypothetical protein [Bacteriophage sp.]